MCVTGRETVLLMVSRGKGKERSEGLKGGKGRKMEEMDRNS